MNLFSWFWPRSARNEALSLYREGLASAEKDDSKAALLAYTAAIDQPAAPDDVRAMAMYNRALIFAAQGKTAKAAADLEAVLAMPITVRGVKLAARRRLERLEHRRDAAVRLD